MTAANLQVELMKKARSGASFTSKNLTHFIYGGEDAFEKREVGNARVASRIGPYNQMTLPQTYTGGDREEQYNQGLKWARILMEEKTCHGNDSFTFETHENAAINASPFGLHTVMFIPTIRLQGTLEQRKYWLPLAESGQIIGSYAQTELGHGSFVRGLETTAVLDLEADEFIINSPTITSTKYWPGGLGFSASHAIVVARLIIKSKDYGIHFFIVPIRSLKTWQALSGVELGDLGLKIGLNSTDNGYSIFNNVRIPRANMLMGLAQVESDGTYSRKGRAQAAYGTMLLARLHIIKVVAFQLAQATTIATRYSTVRTQGYGHYSKSDIELPLMHYKSQHSRLLGLSAQAFAILFASKACITVHQDPRESTPYIHAIVSGLKAYATQKAADGAEDARKCCGGQGYAVLSGLPDIVALVTPQCSWEGDNIVLYQQTARYLMRSVHSIHQGKDTHPSMSYIIDATSPTAALQSKCPATASNLLLPETQLAIFRHRAARLLLSSFAAWSKTLATEGASKAWNKHMLRLIAAARAHIEVFVLEAYLAHVAAIPDTATRLVMQKNCTLFALSSVLGSADFFEDGYLSLDQAEAMREITNGLVEDLVPEAVALTDAWAFSDANLKSAIGVWDGNVYETLISWTRQLPINCNLQKEGGGVAGSAWREVIGPMVEKAREENAGPDSGVQVKIRL